MFTLAFTAAVCLELFSLIGSWFIAAVEPLSQGITDFANKRLKGRAINIGLDWPFIAGRAEIWATANVLAPIMLLEAIFLPGNKLLPLGGIIAMGVTPALLVVTRGKLIRMIVIGAVELPLFLWSGTLIAPFVTKTAKAVGAFPSGLNESVMISHTTMEGPIEKFLGYLVGHMTQGELTFVLYAALALAAYLLIFVWYAYEMKKRNAEYSKAE
nr:PTS transporter subunit IIC [Staphylococcus sp. IVB6238]